MKNPVTTITGIVMIILSGLTLFGLITQEESGEIEQYAAGIIEGIVGLIAIFKAGDKDGGV
jgi:hypothetical protein